MVAIAQLYHWTNRHVHVINRRLTHAKSGEQPHDETTDDDGFVGRNEATAEHQHNDTNNIGRVHNYHRVSPIETCQNEANRQGANNATAEQHGETQGYQQFHGFARHWHFVPILRKNEVMKCRSCTWVYG